MDTSSAPTENALLRARVDEDAELISGLLTRCGKLRAAVTMRDERIAELETALQAATHQEPQR